MEVNESPGKLLHNINYNNCNSYMHVYFTFEFLPLKYVLNMNMIYYYTF